MKEVKFTKEQSRLLGQCLPVTRKWLVTQFQKGRKLSKSLRDKVNLFNVIERNIYQKWHRDCLAEMKKTKLHLSAGELFNIISRPEVSVRKALSISQKWYTKSENEKIQKLEEKLNILSKEGKTPLIIFEKQSGVLGIIGVKDVIRKTSKEAMAELKKLDIETVMLTGDNQETAKVIAKEAGMDKVIAGVLPEGKEEVIRKLQETGKNVSMVGDGINDAPPLTRADTGVAIGAGTDVAIESASVILVKNDLLDFVNAIKLSKAVIKNIKQNLFWAFFYNSIGIPLAAGVFASSLGWRLNPMFGAAAMGLSSVFVVTNALRLKFFKGIKKPETDINETIERSNEMDSRKVEIVIDGMACSHCSGRVEQALNALEGVSATVDLAQKTAFVTVTGDVSNDKLSATVTDCGYTVVEVK